MAYLFFKGVACVQWHWPLDRSRVLSSITLIKSQQHLFQAVVMAVVAMTYVSLRLRKHICVTFCYLLSKTNVSVFKEFIFSDYQKESVHIILQEKKNYF